MKRTLLSLTLPVGVALLVTSCATGKLHLAPHAGVAALPDERPLYSIFAVGDAGEDNAQSKEVLAHFTEMATRAPQPATALFLGDNLYPAGLAPKEDHARYTEGASLLRRQVEALDNFPGSVFYLPGNHDWNEFKPGGLAAIRRQGEFIHNLRRANVQLYPMDGCSGPVAVELSGDLVLFIIDSQWWIQDPSGEPGINDGCDTKTKEAFLQSLRQMIRQYGRKQIVIALHHPPESRGLHGGYFTFRDHVFPLTHLANWLYVPLPLVGSIYPWYRSLIGHSQDLRNKRYRSLADALFEATQDLPNVLFLSGHDHSLQYLRDNQRHIIISGAGSKQNAVAKGKHLVFGHQAGGFVVLDFFSQRRVGLRIYEVGEADGGLQLVFDRLIIDPSAN